MKGKTEGQTTITWKHRRLTRAIRHGIIYNYECQLKLDSSKAGEESKLVEEIYRQIVPDLELRRMYSLPTGYFNTITTLKVKDDLADYYQVYAFQSLKSLRIPADRQNYSTCHRNELTAELRDKLESFATAREARGDAVREIIQTIRGMVGSVNTEKQLEANFPELIPYIDKPAQEPANAPPALRYSDVERMTAKLLNK